MAASGFANTPETRVRHRQLVGGHDQRRRQPAATHEQFAQRGAVAREVEHGLDAARPDRPHLLRHVAPVVDAVGRAEVAHEVLLVARFGGRDHGRAPRRDELDDVGADPARRTADQDGLAGRRGDRVDRLEGRRSGQAEHAGGGEVDALGDARQVRTGGHREVFGERPAAERRRVEDDAEDAVAGGEAGHPGPDRLDRPCEVLAEYDREAVLQHALQPPARDGQVDAVDRGGVHAHQHLPRLGLWHRDVRQRGLALEVRQDECAHGGPPRDRD